MKKTIILITAVMICLSAAGCSDSQNDTQENSDDETSLSEQSSETVEESSHIKPVSSSLTSPLGMEEWGNAAKFSTSEQKYYNVPIRIISVTADSRNEKTVKDFTENNKSYTYHEPAKDCQWVIAEYEIDLGGFPVDEGGTDISVVSFVTGTDGQTLEYKNKKYSVTTINMTDDKYYFEGIHKGKIAYEIPKSCIDYMLILGEYGETQAYFTQS